MRKQGATLIDGIAKCQMRWRMRNELGQLLRNIFKMHIEHSLSDVLGAGGDKAVKNADSVIVLMG